MNYGQYETNDMYVIELLILIFGMLLIVQKLLKTPIIPTLILTKNPTEPTTLTHDDITTLLTKTGNPELDGVCFGFTLNWAYAVADETEEFFYQQVHLLRIHKINLPEIIEEIKQKKREGLELTPKEKCIETLPDLLRRICVAQTPSTYKETYGKLVWQSDINPILSTLGSQPSKVKQIFYKTHTFSSKNVAVDYLQKLIELGINETTAIVIGTADHAMGFKRTGALWRFININDLYEQHSTRPYFEFNSQQLVEELYRVSTDGILIKRLTVNTDYIAKAQSNYHPLLKPLEDLFPMFPVGKRTSYREKLSFFAMAACQGDMPTVRKCLKSGWSIFSNPSMNENSPIFTAISMGRQEVVHAMMSSIKHRINYKSERNESTLLHVACRYGHSGIVQDLLNIKGIKINLRDKEGMTPLMCACASTVALKEQRLFAVLLAKNPSLTVKDNSGLTALDHARKSGNEVAVMMLEAKLAGQSGTKYKLEIISNNSTTNSFSFFNKKHQIANCIPSSPQRFQNT